MPLEQLLASYGFVMDADRGRTPEADGNRPQAAAGSPSAGDDSAQPRPALADRERRRGGRERAADISSKGHAAAEEADQDLAALASSDSDAGTSNAG